jgi:hypothetical protein
VQKTRLSPELQTSEVRNEVEEKLKIGATQRNVDNENFG